MQSRQKLILVFGAVAIVAAGIVSYVIPTIKAQAKANAQIVTPANKLKELQAKAESLGLSPDPTIQDQDPNPFQMIESAHPGATDEINTTNQPTPNLKLISDPNFPASIEAATQHQQSQANVFTTKDVLYGNETRSTKIIAKSILAQAIQNADKNSHQDFSNKISLSIRSAIPSTLNLKLGSVVARYGIEIEAYRTLYSYLQNHPNLTTQELQETKRMLQSLPQIPTINDVLKRQVQELIVAARHIDSYDESDFRTLNSENRNSGPPVSHPKIKEALESNLLAYYIECQAEVQNLDSEAGGVTIDNITQKWMDQPTDGNYMIRTIGVVFEQLGRNLHRIAQSRAGLIAYLDIRASQSLPSTLPPNLANQLINDMPVTLVLQSTPEGVVLVSDSSVAQGTFRGEPFEVDQQAGVRVALPTPKKSSN